MSTDKPSRNEDEYFARRDAELLKQRQDEARKEAEAAERRSHYMKCPKDGGDLVTQKHQGVQLDACPECGGLWLDAGELEQLQAVDDKGMLRRVIGDVMTALGRRDTTETGS